MLCQIISLPGALSPLPFGRSPHHVPVISTYSGNAGLCSHSLEGAINFGSPLGWPHFPPLPCPQWLRCCPDVVLSRRIDPWIGIACCPGEDSVVEIIQEVWAACRESAVLYLRTLVFLLRLGRQGTWELKLIYEHVCKSCYLTETFLSAYKH